MKKLFLSLMILIGGLGMANAKSLVAYFSVSGNTKAVAEKIAKETGSDLYEIKAKVPYTDADTNWHDRKSRTTIEMQSSTIKPELAEKDANVSGYDTIYLGYPIWWGEAPHILWSFLESYNFEGKTIIPFCTSSSSPLGRSDVNIHKFAPKANWQKGKRFSERASENEVRNWVKGL